MYSDSVGDEDELYSLNDDKTRGQRNPLLSDGTSQYIRSATFCSVTNIHITRCVACDVKDL